MVKIGQIFKHKNGRRHSLHEKCPYSQLLWSAFSRIWTEYGEILLISNLRIFSPNEGNVDQNNSEYRQFFAVIISIHQNIYSVSVTDHPMSFKHWGGFTISRELILKMNALSWHLLPYFYPFPKVEECYTNVRWIVTFWVIFADNLRVTTSVSQIRANYIINMSGIGWVRPNKSHKFHKINLSDITRCYLLKIYFSTYLFYN